MNKEDGLESFVDSLMRKDMQKARVSSADDADALADLWEKLGELEKSDRERARSRFDASLEALKEREAEKVLDDTARFDFGYIREVASWAGIAAIFALGIFVGTRFSMKIDGGSGEGALAYHQNLDALRALAMLQEESPSDRLRGVYECAALDVDRAVIVGALLRSAKNDENANVRVASLQVLERFIDDVFLREEMRELLDKPQPPLVKIHLIRTLSQVEDASLIPFLERVASDPMEHRLTREQAREALRALNGKPGTVRATVQGVAKLV